MATHGIEEVTENAIRTVARDCGSLSMECSDVTGYVQGVAQKLDDHLKMLDQLEEVTTRLLADQARVSDSTDEARLLSEQAKAKLDAGREAIEGTIEGFKGLTELVVQLGERMAGFAAAMNQVQTVSSTIEELTREAGAVTTEIKTGVDRSRAAQSGFGQISDTVREVSEIVGMVDRQTEGIAHSTNLIQTSVDRVKAGLTDFAGDARDNGSQLLQAQKRLSHLELLSNTMLDTLANSGAEIDDTPFILKAQEATAVIVAAIERGIDEGEVSLEDVFDRDYREIAGTNPVQMDTR